MQPLYDQWHASSHRGIACEKCHGGALTLDARSTGTTPRALYCAPAGRPAGAASASAIDIVQDMMERCEECHRQEYAAWQTGPHSATYARIFLDKKYNAQNMPMDDCLRCHGMHFEGGIADLVAPVNRTGPWRLMRPELANLPAMPCLTCHQMHREGPPLKKTGVEGRVPGPSQEIARPSLAFFDRRSQQYIPLAELPMPEMLEGTRAVKMSPDQRQALCYQCHAPVAAMQVARATTAPVWACTKGSVAWRATRSTAQKTRASCATCHPKMSNCGLDVEKMDTTFASTNSKHNIHWVKCQDCHTKGVPKKKEPAVTGVNP